MSIEENKAVVRRFFEELMSTDNLSAHKPERVKELIEARG